MKGFIGAPPGKPPSSLTGHNTDINLRGLLTRGVYGPEFAVIYHAGIDLVPERADDPGARGHRVDGRAQPVDALRRRTVKRPYRRVSMKFEKSDAPRLFAHRS